MNNGVYYGPNVVWPGQTRGTYTQKLADTNFWLFSEVVRLQSEKIADFHIYMNNETNAAIPNRKEEVPLVEDKTNSEGWYLTEKNILESIITAQAQQLQEQKSNALTEKNVLVEEITSLKKSLKDKTIEEQARKEVKYTQEENMTSLNKYYLSHKLKRVIRERNMLHEKFTKSVCHEIELQENICELEVRNIHLQQQNIQLKRNITLIESDLQMAKSENIKIESEYAVLKTKTIDTDQNILILKREKEEISETLEKQVRERAEN